MNRVHFRKVGRSLRRHSSALVFLCLTVVLPRVAGGEGLGAALRWTRLRTIRGVRRVFAHPLDPNVAWCATAGGLLATGDDGQTWTPVESAPVEAVGEVTCLAVSTHNPRVICLGTHERGVFLSSDGGKTLRPLASETGRYASKHVEWLAFCPSDPTRRTLLVTHGVSAAGLSISRDLGATWEVLGRDRFLRRFVKRGETIVAAGSMIATDAKVWGVHRSGTDGLRWEETIRNVRASVPVTADAAWQFFVATLDGAILHSADDGKSWSKRLQSAGSSWTGLFHVTGPTDGQRVLAAYDPHRQGLCLSARRFAAGPGQRHNQGLYVGTYVKSGANGTANANGTTYYVAMNNMLWVARRVPPARGPTIEQARCVPCSVRIDTAAIDRTRTKLHAHVAAVASDEPPGAHLRSIATSARAIERHETAFRFTVRARVRHPQGPGAIRRVTVDVSKLGLAPAEAMYDDGKHDDDKAGDGIYAAAIRLSGGIFRQQAFRERRLLAVTAADSGGASASWPAVVHIPRGPAVIDLMQGGWDSARAQGPVTVGMVRDTGAQAKTRAVRFAVTGPGPWRAAWLMPNDGLNSAGLRWLTFSVRADANQDVFVHLVDHHKIGSEGFFDQPHFSKGVPLIAGGYLKAITPVHQKVRIPIDKLLPKGVFFLRWHTAGIGLSIPKGGKPGTYHINFARVEP